MRDQMKHQGLAFLTKVIRELESQGVSLDAHWDIDHLCYRTATRDRYELLKHEIAAVAELLIESEVNGRPISTFKLHEPWTVGGRTVELLELPAPKPSKPTAEGFEHLEVVCDRPFSELKTRFSHLKINESGLAKNFNQEWELEFPDFAVKFHHLSLASVVALEANQKVWGAVVRSRVLELLKPYRPLVAGTFPLGLAVEGSDVDVLLTAGDLSVIERDLVSHFGAIDGFQLGREQVRGEPSLVAGFTFEGVPFELFAQATESVRQYGYRHFQVEERLLKLGGSRFRERVRRLRAEGLKTEPAFARALGLSGDPYEELFRLAGASELDLHPLLESSAAQS